VIFESTQDFLESREIDSKFFGLSTHEFLVPYAESMT
jgi:hypothetical protein